MSVLTYGIMVAESIALDNTTRHAPRARKGEDLMKIVVTGGAGFIGANFVHTLLEDHPDVDVVVLISSPTRATAHP